MIGRPRVELDQHAGGARLVDVGLGEPDLRRPVRVAVELAVQLLGLGVQVLGLLAEPQLGDRVRGGAVQVGGERLLAALAHGGVEDPAGLAREPLGGPRVAVVQVGDHRVQQRRRHRADARAAGRRPTARSRRRRSAAARARAARGSSRAPSRAPSASRALARRRPRSGRARASHGRPWPPRRRSAACA